jgi:hypothetical protein
VKASIFGAGYHVEVETFGSIGAARSNLFLDADSFVGATALPAALRGAKLMAEQLFLQFALQDVAIADPLFGRALGEAVQTVLDRLDA